MQLHWVLSCRHGMVVLRREGANAPLSLATSRLTADSRQQTAVKLVEMRSGPPRLNVCDQEATLSTRKKKRFRSRKISGSPTGIYDRPEMPTPTTDDQHAPERQCDGTMRR